MRFHNVMEEVAGSQEKIRVLRLLLRYPTKRFSGRETARLAEVSAPGAWRILKLFESHGLLERVRVGRSDAWQLRRSNIIAGRLGSFFGRHTIEAEAMDAVKKAILKHAGAGVEKIVLFGSVARGDERPDSDIDVFVVVKNEKDKARAELGLLDAALELYDTVGNRLSTVVYTRKEAERKRDSGLLKNIEKEGRIIYERD